MTAQPSSQGAGLRRVRAHLVRDDLDEGDMAPKEKVAEHRGAEDAQVRPVVQDSTSQRQLGEGRAAITHRPRPARFG
jgi:hypothetical protein